MGSFGKGNLGNCRQLDLTAENTENTEDMARQSRNQIDEGKSIRRLTQIDAELKGEEIYAARGNFHRLHCRERKNSGISHSLLNQHPVRPFSFRPGAMCAL